MKIIYREDDGSVAIFIPAPKGLNPETGNTWTIEELVKRVVPSGKRYKLVEDTDVPADRSFREAWTVDEADLTDGVNE
tara:strand:- start:293 stop:526 length:234 start_codon:yes stop_codon:yes gene_type:complete